MISAAPTTPGPLDAAAPEGFTLPDPAAAPPPLTPDDLITLEREYAEAPPNNDVRRLLAEVRRLQAQVAAAERPTD